jgi:hypothetical protein
MNDPIRAARGVVAGGLKAVGRGLTTGARSRLAYENGSVRVAGRPRDQEAGLSRCASAWKVTRKTRGGLCPYLLLSGGNHDNLSQLRAPLGSR